MGRRSLTSILGWAAPANGDEAADQARRNAAKKTLFKDALGLAK
jgi:hypothetical protein